MALEPTSEQVAAIAKAFEAEALVRANARAGLGYDDFARILWPLIRDMVLDSALAEVTYGEGWYWYETCLDLLEDVRDRIEALKGTRR